MERWKKREIDRGKAGELDFQEHIITMVRTGVIMDYKKPTYTNEPDDGLDYELKAPHNIGDIMDSLINGRPVPPFSDTGIHVRVDVKNPEGKIGKPIVDKFIGDIEKNPKDSEHWLAGGKDLTNPARKALEEAPLPCRYYSWDHMKQVQSLLSSMLENAVAYQ